MRYIINMNKKSIGNFLRKNNAIFSYLKDGNGNRVGVIIAVKSNRTEPDYQEPRIGYAFFNETIDRYLWRVNRRGIREYEMPLMTFSDSPKIMEAVDRLGILSKMDFKNINLPYLDWENRGPIMINPRYIKKLETLQLARKRVNFNRLDFYEDDTELSFAERYVDDADIHAQIRKFEYRALRYFKYIPGHRNIT